MTGGELTRLTGELYLLKANADTVRIEKKGRDHAHLSGAGGVLTPYVHGGVSTWQ